MSVNVGSFLGARHACAPTSRGMAPGAPTPPSWTRCGRWCATPWRTAPSGSASALIYPPGNYASTDELIEIAKAMAPYRRRLHHPHALRGGPAARGDRRGDRDRPRGRACRSRSTTSRRPASATGPRRPQAIAKIDSARAAGQDVSADMYPYIAGGTGLTACLPPWASADGKLIENLPTRPRARASAPRCSAERRRSGRISASSPRPRASWSSACRSPENKQLRGKRLAEIADDRGASTGSTRAMDLILAERQPARHDVLPDERGERQAPAPAAVDQVRHRRRRRAIPPSTHGAERIRGPTAPSRGSSGKYVREREGAAAGGRGPEDDVGRRDAALDSRSRAAARGHVRRHRGVRPRD